jgi:hypothetical protein
VVGRKNLLITSDPWPIGRRRAFDSIRPDLRDDLDTIFPSRLVVEVKDD